jgi:hypothetical protein
VLGEDMRPGVEVACRMVKDAASWQRHHLLFRVVPAVLPNQLRPDYEHFFLELQIRLRGRSSNHTSP